MSRLEKKLKELGYEIFKSPLRNEIYATKTSKNYIYIHITIVENKIGDFFVKPDEDYYVRSIKDINKLNTQYKKLKKDLEILKEGEE